MLNVTVSRVTREPSVTDSSQSLEGASGHVLRLSCRKAPQRLEGASEAGGRLKDWCVSHRLEKVSESGKYLRI